MKHSKQNLPNCAVLLRRYAVTRVVSCGGLFALSGALASPGVFAGTEPSDTAASSTVLEEVVVTAQKRDERLQDVPISVSVLGGEQLESASFQDLSEALNSVPGVVATGSGVTSTLSVRGVAAYGANFQGSSPIGVYLDSIPFGLVRSAIAPDTNAYDLQRVEVLRGPQGTLYGASSEGGLIRVLTNDADLQSFDAKGRGQVSNTDGGAVNYRGDAAVNVPIIAGKLALRGVVGYENLSGWIDSPLATRVNDEQRRNYRLKLKAQPLDNLSIDLSLWSSRDRSAAPPQYSGSTARTSSLLSQPIRVDYDAYGLKLTDRFTEFSLTSATSYLDYKNETTTDLAPGLPSSAGLGLYTSIPAHVLSEEVLLSSNASGPWEWNLGALYRDAENRDFQTLGVLPAPVDFSDSSKSEAIYGELSRGFLDHRLKWTLGLRQFRDEVSTRQNAPFAQPAGTPLDVQSATFHATTPRAVLSWFPDQNLTVYGSFTQGFRSGFPQDFLTLLSAPAFPAVKSDKLNNYEVGAKGNLWNRTLSFDTAVYYMDWRDVQEQLTIDFHGSPVSAPINGSSASGLGVDFSMVANIVQNLSLGLDVSWNDLTNDQAVLSGGQILFNKGDRLGTPEHTEGVFAQYTFPLGHQGLTAHFVASANRTSAFTLPTFVGAARVVSSSDAILISRASFSIDTPLHWGITIYGDNLNNDRGTYTPATSATVLGYRERPRTVGLQVDYHLR